MWTSSGAESGFQDALHLEFRGGAEASDGEEMKILIHTRVLVLQESGLREYQSIACNLDSDGFKKLNEATKEVMGER